MALNDFATSRIKGQPVELYLFTYGPDLFYAYTNAERNIVFRPEGYDEDIEFVAIPIDHGDIESKGAPDDTDIKIVVPRSSAVSELFRGYPPTQPVSLAVWQGNLPNEDDPAGYEIGPNYVVWWRGRVLENEREGSQTTLTGSSIAASMERPGLQSYYQWPCPLAVYDSPCNADVATKSVQAFVVSTTANKVTLVEPWIPDVEMLEEGEVVTAKPGIKKYVGGRFEWISSYGRERRTILRVEGTDTLVVSGTLRELVAAQEVTVILGCDRTTTDCRNLHRNIVNYGGFPYIPDANPVGKNNHT